MILLLVISDIKHALRIQCSTHSQINSQLQSKHDDHVLHNDMISILKPFRTIKNAFALNYLRIVLLENDGRYYLNSNGLILFSNYNIGIGGICNLIPYNKTIYLYNYSNAYVYYTCVANLILIILIILIIKYILEKKKVHFMINKKLV